MRQKYKWPRWFSSEFTCALFLIILVAYIAHGLSYAPALYSDDWSQGIGRILEGNAKWLDLTNRRPLLFTPFLLQYYVLGLNISAYYIVIWVLHIFLAVMLYKIVSYYPVFQRHSFNLFIALLFLVFPTVYVHMWLTMLHGYAALGLALIYVYLLLRFVRGSSWLALILALFCLVTSFGMYEAQLGLSAVWAIILFVFERHRNLARRLSLLAPLLLTGAFMVWRTVGYQTVGIGDAYLGQVVTTPSVLLTRLILGYRINLQWGWTTPIQEIFPGLTNTLAILLLVGFIVALMWFTRLFTSFRYGLAQGNGTEPLSSDQRWNWALPYSLLSLVGLFLIGVGYIPVIIAFLPNLSSIGSRYNIVASIGGSLFWAAILMAGAQLLAKEQRQIQHLFYISLFPLFIIGILTHISVQRHNRQVWQEQQHMWQEMFKVAPDFEDNTMVLIVLPGYEDRVGFQNWQRTPLYAYWDTTAAVNILYDNDTLAGDVIFPNVDVEVAPVLTSEGIQNASTGQLVTYEQTVAFVFESHTRTLSQLTYLPPELVDGAAEPIKLCQDCVLRQSKSVPLRQLVLE